MSVLNVPIQINGGTTVPTSTLLDRELFVTNTRDLYVNSGGSVGKVNCAKSEETEKLVSGWSNSLFNFQPNVGYFTLGYMRFEGGTFTPVTRDYVSFNGVNLLDVPKMVLRNTMYGSMSQMQSISNPTQGQVFFVLQ